MSAGTTTPSTPKVMVWTGRVLSTLVVLLLTMSAAMKFSNSPDLAKGFQQFGYSMDLAAPLGIVELVWARLRLEQLHHTVLVALVEQLHRVEHALSR